MCEKPVIKLPLNEAGYQGTDTWERSSLRAWLNEKFYNIFTEEEKALMAGMRLICVSAGNSTKTT